MKLKQIHNTTPLLFEITDISLKITTRTVFRKETKEILAENIRIKDMYELEYHSKTILTYLQILGILFSFSLSYGIVVSNPHWWPNYVLGLMILALVIRFMVKRTRIYIPTKDQGMICLSKDQPSKKIVEEFIYVLEGKVYLAIRKRPQKPDLRQFIKE